MAKKQKRVDSFFTRNVSPRGEKNNTQPEDQNQESLGDENLPPSSVNDNHGPPPSSTIDNPTFCSIKHDPGLRLPMWKYPVDKRDEIRRAYLRSGPNLKTRGEASAALEKATSFKFVFILHLMKHIFGITEVLCQALQQKSQDILSAVSLVSKTKKLIKTLRDDKWDSFSDEVTNFCEKHGVDVPDLDTPYYVGRGRKNHDTITKRHHFHYDIFNETIDFQLQELDSRFHEKVVELLELSSALDPREGYKSFKIDAICKLAKKYYSTNFTEKELEVLEFQLRYFEADVKDHPLLGNLESIAELCQALAKTRKASHYYLVDRLIRLVLTLPVSTATTERAFSAMKIVKTRLRNRMSDDFISDSLVLYIEKDIARTFSLDSILDDFGDVRERRVQLKLSK